MFADILTQWVRGYLNETSILCSVILEESEQLFPATNAIVWPDIDVIRNSQAKHSRCEVILRDGHDCLWKKGNQLWIPKVDLELMLKIIVCSHCGTIGHRGKDSTKSILLENFWWKTIDKDVDEVVRGCLH